MLCWHDYDTIKCRNYLVWAQRLLYVRFYSQSGRMLPATAVFRSTWDTFLGGVCTSSIYDLLSLRFSLFLSLSLLFLSTQIRTKLKSFRSFDSFIRASQKTARGWGEITLLAIRGPTCWFFLPSQRPLSCGRSTGNSPPIGFRVRAIDSHSCFSHPFFPGQERSGGRSMEESETRRIEEEVRKAVEQAKELQDSAASFIAKASGDEKSLRQRAAALDSTIRRLRSSIGSLLAHKLLDPNLADKASDPPLLSRLLFR